MGCDNVHGTCVKGSGGVGWGVIMSCYASVLSLVLVTHTASYASVMSLVLVTHTSSYVSVMSLVLVMHESCYATVSYLVLVTHTSSYASVMSLVLVLPAACVSLQRSTEGRLREKIRPDSTQWDTMLIRIVLPSEKKSVHIK